MAGLRYGAVQAPTPRSVGDLRRATTKTSSPARGKRRDGSGSKRRP